MSSGVSGANVRYAILRRTAALCLSVLGLWMPAAHGDEAVTKGALDWKSGPVRTVQQDAATLVSAVQAGLRSGARHVVVQFNRPLVTAERAQVAAAGIELLSYVGDNAFYAVVSPERADGAAIARLLAIRCLVPIDRNWKLHPDFLSGRVPEWAVVAPAQESKPDAPPSGPTVVAAYVLFHADVPAATAGVQLCGQYGATTVSTLESINALVIELPLEYIPALADEDGVEWVEPPLPKFSESNDRVRLHVGADTVQAAPYNLNGAGVTVLVYDGGTGQPSHPDFGGRLHVRDSSGLTTHSTHVAGTIGGSGAASGGQYRGMAPAVQLEAYGFQQAGGLQAGFLYTDPGDLQHDYNEAISVHGAHIANNSIGTNTAGNGFPCEWEGNYGVTDVLIDTIVRGDGSNSLFTSPFRVVWCNGNERAYTRCGTTYHTTAPPACSKNHITVGAIDSDFDTMTYFSSWGPTDDGRLKPDVTAPGCRSYDTFGVTSCDPNNGYTVMCGTSMACATVTGISALLLQDYRQQFPSRPDFRNSTLKILLAHTAVDLGNPGPDYQYGYGSVRIQPAVDLLRSGNLTEGTVSQGSTVGMVVTIHPGDTQLKATLAWDDVPGTPSVNPALVNDLDLRVFDANGAQYYPWTLDPSNPGAPAVRTQPNHIDNIEQVVIDNPSPGDYRVEVFGCNVPSGPQPFSLCATPDLLKCSHSGTLELDRPKYACQSQATLRVVDCDLNTSDSVIDTATVTIASTSEPAGQAVLLTETTPSSATFVGTIPLNTAGGSGTLLIAPGDTVTATYIDADNGAGGTNVPVIATAVVDCQPPLISNVQVARLTWNDATITMTANEPVQATIRYGSSCGTLTGSRLAPDFRIAPSVQLYDLTPLTTYYLAIDATDEAGNTTSDDNGGGCYSFTTPKIPNYFTEIFSSDHANDLANHGLLFVPDGSVDFYAACANPLTELPTNPAGGTPIIFNQGTSDGYVAITLNGGATVSLYGISYNRFFVGSNGYITFNTGDLAHVESLEAHFNQPRISAMFDALDPRYSPSALSWKQLPDRVAVTWLNFPEWGLTDYSTFQIEMYFDGRITIDYLTLGQSGYDDGLAGLSAGNGVPQDFSQTDLTAMGPCPPQPPVAHDAAVTTTSNQAVTITLHADDDGLPNPPGALAYIVTSLPARAALTDPAAGAIAAVPYTLAAGVSQVVFHPTPYSGGHDSFTFKANDGGTPPFGGDSNTATVSVAVGVLKLVYSFPLDTDPGWATQGQWAFGTPAGGGTHNHDPNSGHTGLYVYGYNLNGDYASGIPAYYLTTAAINCAGIAGTELRFWRWLAVESATYDHADIAVSNDGVAWTTVWSNGTTSISDSAWTQQAYSIATVADHKPTVYIRWGMGPTDSAVTYPGWNIDDIEIWGATPPCAGDMNCDGRVTFADIDLFVEALNGESAWTHSCPWLNADCSGDGHVTFADIDPFVALIGTTCP